MDIGIGQIKKERNASLELFRIISMLLIITLHFFGHGNILSNVKNFTLPYYFAWTVQGLAIVSVNCYVLLSGYFLCHSEFKWKKVFQLLLEVWFYSIIIYLLMLVTKQTSFSIRALFGACFPILNNKYWFVTTYLIMYCMAPFLNILIKIMSKREFQNLLIILTFILVVWNTVIYYVDPFYLKSGASLSWFLYLYLVAAYIRKYFKINGKKKKWIGIYLFSEICMIGSKFSIDLITYYFTREAKNSGIMYKFNSIFCYMASVSLFLVFLNLKIEKKTISKYINTIAGFTFGVYLIHDNEYVRSLLWERIIIPLQWIGSVKLYINMPIIVIGIFCICICIDFIRKSLFEPIIKYKKLWILIGKYIEKAGRQLRRF